MLEVPTQSVFVHGNVASRPTGGLLVDVNEGETFRRTGEFNGIRLRLDPFLKKTWQKWGDFFHGDLTYILV